MLNMVDETNVEQPQEYNDVDTSEYSLTDDSAPVVESSEDQTTVSALDEGKDAIVKSDIEADQSQIGSKAEWDNPEEYEIDVNGETYSFDDVLKWKQDADNKANWSKSNTQKSQNLAQLGKLFDQISNDESLQDHIKDYYHNNPNGLKDSGLDNVDWGSVPEDVNPEDYLLDDQAEEPQSELAQRVEALEVEKNVQILEEQLDTLENKYSDILGGEKTDKFLQFVDEAGIGDLNIGFRLWATDALLGKAEQDRKLDENRSRNAGKVISKQATGAKQIVQDQPRGPKAWNKIGLEDPEISKYFK
jgi:hypothetical protein